MSDLAARLAGLERDLALDKCSTPSISCAHEAQRPRRRSPGAQGCACPESESLGGAAQPPCVQGSEGSLEEGPLKDWLDRVIVPALVEEYLALEGEKGKPK